MLSQILNAEDIFLSTHPLVTNLQQLASRKQPAYVRSVTSICKGYVCSVMQAYWKWSRCYCTRWNCGSFSDYANPFKGNQKKQGYWYWYCLRWWAVRCQLHKTWCVVSVWRLEAVPWCTWGRHAKNIRSISFEKVRTGLKGGTEPPSQPPVSPERTTTLINNLPENNF